MIICLLIIAGFIVAFFIGFISSRSNAIKCDARKTNTQETNTMTKTSIYYLAGPMTGIDENNYPAFNNAARLLRSVGLQVENPAEHDLPENADYNDYMKAGIKKLMNCTTLILLPGWEQSNGAIIERTVAKLLNITILEWKSILKIAQSPRELKAKNESRSVI